jgi:hypothetical protein
MMGFLRTTALVTFALLVSLALPGAAEAAGKRVGVPKFDGAQEALVRKQVMQVLKAHGYELVKSREVEAAVSSTGALLESDDGFQKVAKELALMAIVTGEVGKKRAKIIVHDGREGSVLGEASFAGANPKKIAAEVGKSFWKQLGADVERGHLPSGSKKPKAPVADAPEDDDNAPEAGGAGDAPPPPEPEPRSKKSKADIVADGPREGEPEADAPKKKKKKKRKDEDTGEDDEAGSGYVPPIFDAQIGAGGVNRAYAYNQDVTGMRPYGLPLGGAATIKLVGYPLALAMDGPLQNLGAEITVEQAFGIASTIGPGDTQFMNTAPVTFATSVHEYAGGARYRIPFGAAGHQLWFSATGGEHAFVFKSAAGCANTMPPSCRGQLDIPDTIYRYFQPGAGARFELGPIAVAATLGYRLIINGAGNHFQTFFPHREVGGIMAEAYVGYRLTDMIELRGGLTFRRYFFSMNSVAADRFRAGGAVDQYISGGVAVAFLLGGSERPEPAAEPEEEEKPKKKKKKKAAEEDASEDSE